MTDFTGVPRAFDIRDAKRAREEEARKREQATSARNTSNTAVGSGGRLDIDGGDLSVFNGGNAVVRDGGRFLVQDGGSMDITDDGQINVVGQGQDFFTQEPTTILSSLANRTANNSWIGYDYLQPGLYFSTTQSRGATDTRVTSSDGIGLELVSAVELLRNSPQAGPNILSKGSARLSPDGVSIGAGAWDDIVNPGGGNGLNGLKGSSFSYFTPSSMSIAVDNYDFSNPAIPQGYAVSIEGTLAEGILRLYGRNGVDLKGPVTVDGAPIGGGAVTSVAGKTGAVTLVKGDIGLSNVDNTTDLSKPISTDTQTALNGKANSTHTHTTTQVTGLDTALAGKASTAVATTSTDGLMSAADKVKLDAAGSATLISCYIATGSKANFATSNQAIATPGFSSSRSNADLATPAAGKLTVTKSGVYTITFSIALFTTAAMTTIKPVTGRSFVDISDSASAPYSRTAIPVGEDFTTGNQGGILLAAGAELMFNIIQTSGGTAYYRATIWIVKHP